MKKYYCDICNKEIFRFVDMYKLFASPSDIVSLEFHNLACCTECLKKLENKVKELRSETKKL